MNGIFCGNSIDLLKNMPSNYIHAIISDIPYGIGFDDWDVLHNNRNNAYGGSSVAQKKAGNVFKRRGKPLNGWSEADRSISKEYQEWCNSWASEWYRVLKPGSTVFIFAGRRYAHRCIVAMEDAGFNFKDMLAWEKENAPYRAQRLSSIYKRRNDVLNEIKWRDWRVANLRPIFEPVLWFQKPYKIGGTIADNVLKENVGAWNENALKKYNLKADKTLAYSNIIKVKIESSDHGKHVAQKPLNLMKLLVELVTVEGQIVLDPFMGSGTTCIAAKMLDRKYIGIDIDPKNVKIAINRLEKLTKNQIILFD